MSMILTLWEVHLANQSNQIGQDVEDLDAWAKDNYLTLNPSKCKVMQICFKKEVPALQITGTELKVVSKTKLLGLTVQSYLSWQTQINNMVSKVSRRLYMLSRLRRFGVPSEDLISVYMGYVRTICEYAAPVWHSSITVDQSKKLERIQKRVCRIILSSKYQSYTETLNRLELQTLEDRRLHLCHRFGKKKFLQSKQYNEWSPPPNPKIHSIRLRNTHKFHVRKCNTNREGTVPSHSLQVF